ncbi:HNH endonuclease [Synechococcus sp. A15-127]|uniref:HNH endonuclease n=1 Tax=Synechococcus sp. A15-127 TaxID=1050624 RepID=UPI0016443AC0|nr:HNH endonuclease [Synechococcus sp. A15-127]
MNDTQKCCSLCSKTFPATREYFGHYSRNGNFKPNCRECERLRVKTWRKKNPEMAKAGYKQSQNKLDGWAPTAQLKVDLYLKAGGSCRYCEANLGRDAQIDHTIPVARGGTNKIENLALICARCNQEKDAKTPEEYAKWKMNTA